MDRKWDKEDIGMFSTEQRRVAIEAFIEYGHGYADTIAGLGYPNRATLRPWWRECESTGVIPEGRGTRQPKYGDGQMRAAVDHYLEHGRSLSRTMRALGYPRGRQTLCDRVDELAPGSRKQRGPNLRARPVPMGREVVGHGGGDEKPREKGLPAGKAYDAPPDDVEVLQDMLRSWFLGFWVAMVCPFGSRCLARGVHAIATLGRQGSRRRGSGRTKELQGKRHQSPAICARFREALGGARAVAPSGGVPGMMGGGLGVSGRRSPHEAGRHGLGVAGASPARRYGMWEGPVPRVRGCASGMAAHAVGLAALPEATPRMGSGNTRTWPLACQLCLPVTRYRSSATRS